MSKISNEMIPIEITPTDLSSGITIVRNACYRIGKLVVINLVFLNASALSQFAKICTFPRPACQTTPNGYDNILRLYDSGTPFDLLYDGRLVVDDALQATTTTVSGCYITRD